MNFKFSLTLFFFLAVSALAQRGIVPECVEDCFKEVLMKEGCWGDDQVDFECACPIPKFFGILFEASQCAVQVCPPNMDYNDIYESTRDACESAGSPVEPREPVESPTPPKDRDYNIPRSYAEDVEDSIDENCKTSYTSLPVFLPPSPTDPNHFLPPSPTSTRSNPSTTRTPEETTICRVYPTGFETIPQPPACHYVTSTRTSTIYITSKLAPYPSLSGGPVTSGVAVPTGTGIVPSAPVVATSTMASPPLFTGRGAVVMAPAAMAAALGIAVGFL